MFAYSNKSFIMRTNTSEWGYNMAFSFKPLWHLLLEKDMTKTEFREALGLSTSTLAKLGKDEYVALEVLDKICNHFGVPVEQIIEHKPEN